MSEAGYSTGDPPSGNNAHSVNEEESSLQVFDCSICGKKYKHKRTLTHHMAKIHQFSSKPKTLPFKCKNCNAQFKREKNLKSHSKKNHGEVSTKKMCPLCRSHISDVSIHLSADHNINLEVETKEFNSYPDFLLWKGSFERETGSKYVLKRGIITTEDSKTIYFGCFRSGNFTSRSTGKRLLCRRSCKINASCTSRFKVVENKASGKCSVTLTKTHIGHGESIGFLKRSATRDAISGERMERFHLFTKEDLHNIKSCYNLGSEATKHRNDFINLESWIEEMKDDMSVLLYKPQGTTNINYPLLKENDFVLAIMNRAQSEILKTFACDTICVDSTHVSNSSAFDLTTLLVIDDLKQGFPCSFLISNRTDKDILAVFFSEIKNGVGILNPKTFMSDISENFYNAWINVMNVPDTRLYCTWHVDRAWKNNLKIIKNKEKQAQVYKQLRTLLEERDQNAFPCMISKAHSNWHEDKDCNEFALYFRQNHLTCMTAWAYCYRQHIIGLNTNTNIEHMHKSIKYIYLKGKQVKRLDKSVHAIMRFVRDKLVDQSTVINKGKLTSKIKELHKRHKNSDTSFHNTQIRKEENKWNVSAGKEFYLVEEIKKNCTCQIRCAECESCIHQYICSCTDSAIKWNMCNHIHSVCKFRTLTEVEDISEDYDLRNDLCIEESPDSQELHSILEPLNKNKLQEQNSLQKTKETMIKSVTESLLSISTIEEAQAIGKILASINPTLMAMRSTSSEARPSSGVIKLKKIFLRKKRIAKIL